MPFAVVRGRHAGEVLKWVCPFPVVPFSARPWHRSIDLPSFQAALYALRLSGVSEDTVTKLVVDTGRACAAYQDEVLRDLPSKRIQVDEMWSFVYSKQKNVPEGMEGITTRAGSQRKACRVS